MYAVAGRSGEPLPWEEETSSFYSHTGDYRRDTTNSKKSPGKIK